MCGTLTRGRACFCDAMSTSYNFLIAGGERGRTRRKSTIPESVSFIVAPFARHLGSRIASNREIRNSFNVTENKGNEKTPRKRKTLVM